MSHSASFLHLNGFPKSTSFHAECSDVFYKGEFNAANSLPASDAEEFFARNYIISKENTQSEVSDSLAQFWKVPSETSDAFTTIETCSFYSVDSYFCTQGFGLTPPFFKNLRENLKKNKKNCNFHLVDVFYLLS